MDELDSGSRIEAIPPIDLASIRSRGRDSEGNAVRSVVAQERGAPLPCCLREAEAFERLALVAYRPPAVVGLYSEVGPVFIHADDCTGYATTAAYPEAFRHRRQVFRPYDAAGDMVYDAIEIVDGAGAEAAIARILARPEVRVIHSRNVLPGRYMFSIFPAPAA